MAKNIIFWNRADASLENNGLYLSHQVNTKHYLC